MQFSTSSIVLFLSALASAAPTTTPTTTLQFTNDATGRSANVNVPLTYTPIPLSTLLDGTALYINDTFPATSFFLQSNFQGVECDLLIDGWKVVVTEQHTFAGIAKVNAPLDLCGATVTCFKV